MTGAIRFRNAPRAQDFLTLISGRGYSGAEILQMAREWNMAARLWRRANRR